MLPRERPSALRAPGCERGVDRRVLVLVREVELVDRPVTRCPDRGPGEGTAGALCDLLDVGQVGDARR